jgi:hypothetical protein
MPRDRRSGGAPGLTRRSGQCVGVPSRDGRCGRLRRPRLAVAAGVLMLMLMLMLMPGASSLRTSHPRAFVQAARRRRQRASSLTTSNAGAQARSSRQARRRVSRLAAGIDAASMACRCQLPNIGSVPEFVSPPGRCQRRGGRGFVQRQTGATHGTPRNKPPTTPSLACARPARSESQRHQRQTANSAKGKPRHHQGKPLRPGPPGPNRRPPRQPLRHREAKRAAPRRKHRRSCGTTPPQIGEEPFLLAATRGGPRR